MNKTNSLSKAKQHTTAVLHPETTKKKKNKAPAQPSPQ